MPENVKLTREQVIFLSFIGIIGNIVYSHTWIDNNTDRSAWVASLLGILLVIPFAVWIFYLGKFYPEGTIFDILEMGIGKLPARAISLIYIFINIAVAVAQLNMFTEMLNVFFLQYTPPWAIMLFLTIIGAIFVNGGIRNFARLVETLAVLGSINYFVSFIFAFPRFFHIEYVIPIFDTSFTGFLKGTLFMAGGASECLLLLMVIVRYIPDPEKHYMWVAKGIALSAVIFSSAILVIIAMMSPELAKRIAFGGVNAARLIKIGEFIQGMEIFIFVTYQFIAIGKITMCMYCSWTSTKKIFNNKKPLLQLIITVFMVLIPSLWLISYNKAYLLAVVLANYIILPFSILILLLASICIFIKKETTECV
jgi:spore germination protein (amino acid permease)